MSDIEVMTAPRWGVPDWQDAGAYPAPETPLHEWRWQFLRRRPDYRQFWTEWAVAHFEDRMGFAKFMRQNGYPDYPLPEWRCGWVLNGVSFFDGVSSVLDPSYPTYMPCIGIFEPRPGSYGWRCADFEAQRAAEDAGRFPVEFDLNEPLAEQLERARRRLEAEQIDREGELVKAGRMHREKWPLYLRVIDARDDRQSWGMIAGLLPATMANRSARSAKQVYDQAVAMMFKLGR